MSPRPGSGGRPSGAWPEWELRARGVSMKRYLLSIFQPDGELPASEVLETIAGEARAVSQATHYH